MQTKEFIARYKQVASKIHAICADLRLPTSDAKLFTYIHVKLADGKKGSHYFDHQCEEDILALEALLSQYREIGKGVNTFESIARSRKRLSQIDYEIHKKLGFEFPLKYELQNRLRLYKDADYRSSKLSFYWEKIQPQLAKYDDKRIAQAFQNEQIRLEQTRRLLKNRLR